MAKPNWKINLITFVLFCTLHLSKAQNFSNEISFLYIKNINFLSPDTHDARFDPRDGADGFGLSIHKAYRSHRSIYPRFGISYKMRALKESEFSFTGDRKNVHSISFPIDLRMGNHFLKISGGIEGGGIIGSASQLVRPKFYLEWKASVIFMIFKNFGLEIGGSRTITSLGTPEHRLSKYPWNNLNGIDIHMRNFRVAILYAQNSE